jgi:hypothetical protein
MLIIRISIFQVFFALKQYFTQCFPASKEKTVGGSFARSAKPIITVIRVSRCCSYITFFSQKSTEKFRKKQIESLYFSNS